ncbi:MULTISPECIES: plasmid partitioning protein RepB C-terminal domain-containing protein [unclassified Mesorhizobium]|uniref:plasmid partitioning protein RepB C-terminal domain-containing protein n=1 Tax=unclassified Mesorhizobium TaxID=325217 RepID=UPI002415F84E|nr:MULTISPECIES: plasmid partitioning protein RepB C-terminal domain-containing protein [unclassified Mesorhizobium]WFP65676.1 plasmid partitioning protein RepB C-terminal domain-containing protein [Mesorhizobium sp. WSM4904]WFP78938.1 plasmid partitioning protein RepB C-terminal domain-containing protein [Mesorhizobium sp. WSM4906]
MNVKRLSREAAYEALLHSDRRNARRFALDQQAPRMRRFGPRLLKTYVAECKRKRAFIEESEELEKRLECIAAAVLLITGDWQFRALLASEGLATMPKSLAQRVQGLPPAQRSLQPASVPSAPLLPAGEVCPEVRNLLRDCTGPAKLFALLGLVVPVRQVEIARLMIAMKRVRFNYVKMLVALTPRSLLAKDADPRKEIAGLSEDQMAEMEPELAKLCLAYLSAVERRGPASLELVAASRYFDRLMDSSKVVRYLAHNFPGHFEEFHSLSVPVLE